MENEWKKMMRWFPKRLASALTKAEAEDVREIRLRRGRPLTLSTSSGEYYVQSNGDRSTTPTSSSLYAFEEDLEETVLRLCGYALHAHQEELREGYITTDTGLRVGIGGTVTAHDGKPISVHSITSLCLRVRRLHADHSAPLCRRVTTDGIPRSLLLCGQPSSGKTSLLRDMATRLSEGKDGRRWRVAVVDERGELSYGDALRECDVIRNCPKAEGIRRAVRLLAPDFLFFDEWSTEQEAEAVADTLPCGVAVVTSCHAESPEALARRRLLLPTLESGFEWVVQLRGSDHPGEWVRTERVGDLFAANRWTALVGLDRLSDRELRGECRERNDQAVGTKRPYGVASGGSPALHRSPDPVAAAGAALNRELSCPPLFEASDRRPTRAIPRSMERDDRPTPAVVAGDGAGAAACVCRSAGNDRSGWTNGTLPAVCETV